MDIDPEIIAQIDPFPKNFEVLRNGVLRFVGPLTFFLTGLAGSTIGSISRIPIGIMNLPSYVSLLIPTLPYELPFGTDVLKLVTSRRLIGGGELKQIEAGTRYALADIERGGGTDRTTFLNDVRNLSAILKTYLVDLGSQAQLDRQDIFSLIMTVRNQ